MAGNHRAAINASDAIEFKLLQAHGICTALCAGAAARAEIPTAALENSLWAARELIEQARAEARGLYEEWKALARPEP